MHKASDTRVVNPRPGKRWTKVHAAAWARIYGGPQMDGEPMSPDQRDLFNQQQARIQNIRR